MGVLVSYGLWLKGRNILKDAVLRGPDKVKTIIVAVDGTLEVAVIRKVDTSDERGGRFLDFKVENKPFPQVVGAIKRHNTRLRKKLSGGVL